MKPLLIRVTGPESSGKSTLARDLAVALDGLYVAEYAREYLRTTNGAYAENDLLKIWQHQWARTQVLCGVPGATVVCDTGPENFYVWAQTRYGQVDRRIQRAVRDTHYDLTIVCTPDLPWVADPLRESPSLEERVRLFGQYIDLTAGPRQVVVAGPRRLSIALAAVLRRDV